MISFLIFLVILLTFGSWFGPAPISSGDMGFFYPEQIRQYLNFPYLWETFRDTGLGGVSFLSQGVYFYNLPMGFLGQFLKYGLIERLIWFWPILIIGLASPFLLAKELNLFPAKLYPFSSLIFFLNTYFLMIMGGGQLTVALAYILIPLSLALFLKVSRRPGFRNIIFFSLALVFLVAWDFRFTYLLGIILSLYLFSFSPETVKNLRKYFKIFFITGVLVLGIHSFWLLPFFLNYQNPVVSFAVNYTTSDAVRFFSFADFPHALALLHPNWPENIFGKTYFMQGEFLTMPILAYLSLFFAGNKARQGNRRLTVLFFAFLGLIGAFMAKGSNEPLGGIYLWMFNHVPGMVMFRDPTKFYTLTALSYSILIPYSVWQIIEWLKSKFKAQNLINPILILFFIFYFLFLLRPAWTGHLGGTFKAREIPQEYLDLKKFLATQPEFFRTFWIPVKQRFTFYSDNHPAIDGADFLQIASASGIVEKLKNKETENLLSLAGVKYVIVSYDSEGEIFIKDRKYDKTQRKKIEEELNKLPFLKKLSRFKLNAVYQTSGFNDRFWLEKQGVVNWKMVNPTEYLVSIKNLKEPGVLVFAENYNTGWKIKVGGQEISSQKIYGRFNSFKIEKTGNVELTVEFAPQKYLYLGLLLTGLTLISSLLILLV